ncbi:MAG: hypothetical protein JXR18_01350 [Neptuniibacter sp.]
MAEPEIIEKSCFFLSNIDCYAVVKDFSGPLVAVAVAFLTVKFAFRQISQQHSNTIEAQKENSKRDTRIELFKDINLLLDQSSSVIRDVNSYCMGKKYSNPQMESEINHEEYLALMSKFGQALLAVISKIESHEIVNLMLFRVFRFSLQSIHHDLLSMQFEQNRKNVLESFLELTNDAQMYFSDFQVCMQNMAYGEVFDSAVPHRVPAYKRYKVITNDAKNLEELHHYFWRETNWGKSCMQYEKEAAEKFSS